MTLSPTHARHSAFELRQGIATVLVAGLLVWPVLARAVDPIHTLKEISAGAAGSDPRDFCAFNNQVFFQASDSANGAELWVSDTSESGTALFADIVPGAGGSFPESFTAYNGKLYFSAYDGAAGRDLYATTGATGNISALGVYPGNHANPKHMTVANGLLFFTADLGAGVELCRTNGTTVDPEDINPGAGGSFPDDFVVLGTNLYFTADDGAHGREIWKSDGTTTELLADIRAGAASSSPSSLAVFNDKLYFAADNGVNGSQLWVSTGEAGNAQMVDTLTEPGDFALPSRMTAVGNTLFLASRGDAAGAPTGMELWWTNGAVGTLGLMGDIQPGVYGSNPACLTAYDDVLVFSAADNSLDNELWTSNGTVAGTVRIKDINPGVAGSQPGPFFASGGSLYFAADTAAEGRELWQTDGTTANTVLLKNINPDSPTAAGSDPDGFVELRGRVIFAATAADGGREPWIVDNNTAPVITEGSLVSVTMSQDGAPTAFSLTLHATDANSDTLTWSITTAAGHGTATASGTGNALAIGYTPNVNYVGDDTFAVGIDDGHGGTDACTVNVTIDTTVPDVVGMTEAAAGTALTTAGLVKGAVTQKYSTTVPAGQVISQNPAAGGTATAGTAVALVLSKGAAPPMTGSIVINGNGPITNSAAVTLSLTWGGGTGVTRMRFSNDGATWSGWQPLSPTAPHTLRPGDGQRTVRVQYLDSANTRSAVFSDYILVDATPPTGTIVINGNAETTDTPSVTLTLNSSDAGTGVTGMRFSDNGATWSPWMGPGATYPYILPAWLGYHTVRVQYRDRAGNYSAVFSDYIRLVGP